MLRFPSTIIGKLWILQKKLELAAYRIDCVFFVQVFLVFSTIGFVVVSCRDHKYLDPQWIDPHDWSKNRDPLDELCPKTEACKPCEKTARSEYLRLVNTIFDPSEFRVCKFFSLKQIQLQFDFLLNYLKWHFFCYYFLTMTILARRINKLPLSNRSHSYNQRTIGWIEKITWSVCYWWIDIESSRTNWIWNDTTSKRIYCGYCTNNMGSYAIIVINSNR